MVSGKSNLDDAVKAAEDFEEKHYETNSFGEAEELDASDFKAAAAKAGDTISDAATAVKEAVVGPSAAKDGSASADASATTPPPDAPSDAAAAGEKTAPSLVSQLQEKTAGALESLQKAVEPKPDSKSPDPEVNEFRSLVGEVFSNMKESIASGTSTQQEPAGQEAGAVADTSAHKSVASSPAEAHRGLFGQAMGSIFPVVEAEGRSPGKEPDGRSKGLIEDLAENVEEFVEEVAHHRGHGHGHSGDRAGRSAGQKWQDAKDEANESGYQAKESVRDAAGALGDKTRRGADRAADKTQGFLNRAGDASVDASREFVDRSRDAKDRVKRDFPGAEVRGVVGETEELAHRAKDRVASDWEATKQGTRRMLDESSAARRYEAEHPPPKEPRGFFGSILDAIFGSADKTGDKAQDAADTAADKAREAKDSASGFFNKAGEEAQRTADRAEQKTRNFFSKAGDEAERTADRTQEAGRGFFGRAEHDSRRAADRAEGEARGFWGRTRDETGRKVDRFGNAISESAEDAKRTVQDKLEQAEDFLLHKPPVVSIPSNTQDVLAARASRN